MATWFVTGTGTDVGKTYVTAALATALRAAGRSVRALKPVASGFDPAAPEASDTGQLLRAGGLPLDAAGIAATSPWRFAAPLSPDMAAAREARRIDFDALVAFCRTPAGADVTLIEGIGGVMVPLDEHRTVLDWIEALSVPVLLVAGSYLGTLSHTLTAAGMLATRGVRLAEVVISESAEQPVPSAETVAALRRFLGAVPVSVLARRELVAAAGGGAVRALAERLAGT